MPTLLDRSTFSFHPSASVPSELKRLLDSAPAIDIITTILRTKLARTGSRNRLYFLRGRTGSGKSTLMISTLYDRLISTSNSRIFCTEPRVVLTRANATDVIRHNPTRYALGKQVGIISGAERVMCTSKESIYYCTTQIMNDMLLSIIHSTDIAEIKHKLSAFRIIVVDEVHVLDTPMMALLKTIHDVIDRYGDISECPLFVFTSATIDIDQMVSYFCGSTLKVIKDVLSDPYMIGEVAGSSNFEVIEEWLEPSTLAEYNKIEHEAVENDPMKAYTIIAEHFMNHYYNRLDSSTSFINVTTDGTTIKVQCRDVLVFLPLVTSIEAIGKEFQRLITDRPTFVVRRGTTFDEVVKWRTANKGKPRVLIIGFARGYSKAGDELLSKPIETDVDALKNEIRIVSSTPVIETGKTIATVYMCIDMGLTTSPIYSPLTYDFSQHVRYIKQIPANMNQTIQRLGRIGREAPGLYLHFYSKEVMERFQKTDTAETVNCPCLSGLLISHIKGQPINGYIDIVNANNYLHPTSVDVMIRTANDLMSAGYLTVDGKYVNLRSTAKYSENWILYAKQLHYVKGWSLWNALLIAALNRKSLPPMFDMGMIDPKSLRVQLEDLDKAERNDDLFESIQKARNVMTSIMYSKDRTFAYVEKRMFENAVELSDEEGR